jgi:signal transduction histidine kinase
LSEEKEEKIRSETNIEKTEILFGSDKIVKRAIDDFHKIKERFDNCTDATGPSVFFNTPVWNEFVNLKNRGIKLRFITEITKDNVNYCKELIKITELRHIDGIKGNFGISDGKDYGGSASVKEGQPPVEIMRSNIRTFVEQQQFFFETLWSRAVPAEQKIKEIEEGVEPVKTKVIENSNEILEQILEFTKKSKEIKSCSVIDGIKLSYDSFYDSYKKLLEKYRNREHDGVRWVTSINNKEDAKLIKNFSNESIKIRHVEDVSFYNFSLSDKQVLSTIDKMEEGSMVTSVLLSNNPLYINHYNSIFEKMWRTGIDANQRIKDIEGGYVLNIETISNSIESLKFSKELLQKVKNEILIMLASSSTFFRFENSIGFNALEDLAHQNIQVKVLIPSKIELQNEINQIIKKYHKIEFRLLHSDNEPFIGITIIDRQRVLIYVVKDDNKINYVDSIGMTIYIEGKSTAMSYITIFNSLWKQTDLYEKLEKSYEKIKSHDKMQRDFINVAAHELRTPIQPIIGFTEHLRTKITDREQLGFIDIIYRNTKRLKKLSEDILEVSKIENNLLNLNKEEFKIKELILQIISDYKKEAETKNIEFEFIDHYNNDFYIYADKDRISQVISNLIGNSIKFITDEKGSKISISVKKRTKDKDEEDDDFDDNACSNNNMITITIKDDGVGIDKDILPILFTKFASKSFQGTGLGLYICRNIVKAHGGSIWAKNNNDRKGATFSFTLPFDK